MATPRAVFRRTMGRVEGLLELHPVIHGGPGRPKQAVSDVLRGALVLGLAALDAVVLDSLIRAVPKVARGGGLGPTAEKWIKEAPDEVLNALSKPDPWLAFGELCASKLGVITFQRSNAIAGVMNDLIRSDSPWTVAAERLGGSEEGWTEKSVCEDLDSYVKRRNQIVHGGDMSTGQATAPIRLDYVETGVAIAREVGEAVCTVVERRVRQVSRS